MKTIMKLFCLALTLSPLASFSQCYYPWKSDLDVDSLFVGNRYTKQQVEAVLGPATDYQSDMSEEFGFCERYHFGDNLLTFSEGGVFDDFALRDNRFKIYTKYGGITIGDPVSRFEELGLGTPVLGNDGKYRLYLGDCTMYIGHSDGKITLIWLFVPV